MKQSPLFSNIETGNVYSSSDSATYGGISLKTFILIGVAILFGCATAYYLPTIVENNMGGLITALVISSVIGFISVLVGRMSTRFAPYCAFLYAACEGLFLGTITALLETVFPGVGIIAGAGTATVFVTMFTLYATGILRVGTRMRRFLWGLIVGAIALTLVTSLLSLTGVFTSLYSNYPWLIIVLEGFFLLYGVFTLLLNFQEATNVVEAGCDKKAEWSVALGFTVSIIYIYIEILRMAYYLYIMFGDRK